MSPFDVPPSSPPVSFDPPPGGGRRSRKRTAVIAVASAGLVAVGAVTVAQFASADDSDPIVRGATPVEPGTTVAPPTTPAPPPEDVPDEDAAVQEIDGQIVIRLGDGEPIVIDIGELADKVEQGEIPLPDELDLGEFELGELGDLGDFEECFGGPLLDWDFDDWDLDDPSRPPLPPLGSLDVFGDGDDLTVVGPDGVSVLDFGEGDGSVTITRENGEITITAEGDVDVSDLSEVLGELPPPEARPMPSLPDLKRVFECIEDVSPGKQPEGE